MAKNDELGGCGTFALIVYIGLGIIAVIYYIIAEGIPYAINEIGKGIEKVEDKVGPTMRKLNNKHTIEDLESDYYFGNKTPSGWGAGEWYKYKTETPHKARQYLNSLATD